MRWDDVWKLECGPLWPVPEGTPGPRLGPYTLVRVLGVGGMSVVVQAYSQDKAGLQHVALKFPLPGSDATEDAVLAEARRAREVGVHPNLVQVVGAGVDDGVPWVAQELLRGVDLSTVLRVTGRLPVRVAVALCAEACEGLAHLHARGTVHRDVKPSNLFVDWHGRLKVMDLGVARGEAEDHHQTQTGRPTGTLPYISPERYSKETEPRSDVWSLGAVLFELLAAERLVQGQTPERAWHDGRSAVERVAARTLELADITPEARDALGAALQDAVRVDVGLRVDAATLHAQLDRLGESLAGVGPSAREWLRVRQVDLQNRARAELVSAVRVAREREGARPPQDEDGGGPSRWGRTTRWAGALRRSRQEGAAPPEAGAVWESPTLGRMRWLPPVTFAMGLPPPARWLKLYPGDESYGVHSVTLSEGRWVMETPVTQAVWKRLRDENPSLHSSPLAPVNLVSWFEAVQFANDASNADGLPAAYKLNGGDVRWNRSSLGYRLLTGAEWEAAAAPGESPDGAPGERSRPRDVGLGRPSGVGLFDMGDRNVYEWVWDPGDVAARGVNPISEGSPLPRRETRGSSHFRTEPLDFRFRLSREPAHAESTQGFRLARGPYPSAWALTVPRWLRRVLPVVVVLAAGSLAASENWTPWRQDARFQLPS